MTICALAPCFAFIEAGPLLIAMAFVAFGLFAGLLVWYVLRPELPPGRAHRRRF